MRPVPFALPRENLVTLGIDEAGLERRLGTVAGTGFRSTNMLRATIRTIGAIVGLAPIEYLTDAERAREDALEELRRNAEALGANAVVNVRFATDECDGRGVRVVAYGDAVVLSRAA